MSKTQKKITQLGYRAQQEIKRNKELARQANNAVRYFETIMLKVLALMVDIPARLKDITLETTLLNVLHAINDERTRHYELEIRHPILFDEYLHRSPNKFLNWVASWLFPKYPLSNRKAGREEILIKYKKEDGENLNGKIALVTAWYELYTFIRHEHKKLFVMKATLEVDDRKPEDICKELQIKMEELKLLSDEVEKEMEGTKPKVQFDETKHYAVVCAERKEFEQFVRAKSEKAGQDVSGVLHHIARPSDISTGKNWDGYFIVGMQYMNDESKAAHKMLRAMKVNEYY